MFERYAPIQRSVKPTVWRDAIIEALTLPSSQLPKTAPQPAGENANAPRSMKYWKEHHPDRYSRLQNARRVIAQIGEDTHTPIEMIVKPKTLRNLCWQDPLPDDIAGYLTGQGARDWQISLVAESLGRVMI